MHLRSPLMYSLHPMLCSYVIYYKLQSMENLIVVVAGDGMLNLIWTIVLFGQYHTSSRTNRKFFWIEE